MYILKRAVKISITKDDFTARFNVFLHVQTQLLLMFRNDFKNVS